MGLHAEVQAVLARFRELGLRAFDDSGKVDPPCVWIPTPALEFNFGKGQISITWQAYLVAPNQNLTSVSPSLSELVDAVSGAFPFTEGEPYSLTLPGGGQPVPAYQLTWSSRSKIGA